VTAWSGFSGTAKTFTRGLRIFPDRGGIGKQVGFPQKE
jgi:hypothetical protein